MIERCRKCDKEGRTTEHIIAECLSLSEPTFLGRHNHLAKIIHQQIAVKYKLLDGNTLLYCTHKPEPVLESANMILYWGRAIINDKMVDFNRPDTLLFDRENKTALVLDIVVPLTHSLPRTEAETVQNMKT